MPRPQYTQYNTSTTEAVKFRTLFFFFFHYCGPFVPIAVERLLLSSSSSSSSCSAICSAHLIFYCCLLLNEMFVLNVWLQRFVKFSRICDFRAVGATPASNAISFLNCTRIDCNANQHDCCRRRRVVSPNQDHQEKSKGIYIFRVTLQLNNTHFSHSTDLQVHSMWKVKF